MSRQHGACRGLRPTKQHERSCMGKQWLKRCAVGAMTVVMTVSSLPTAAFAAPGGYTGGGEATVTKDGNAVTIGNNAISRTFSIADGKLKTTAINNKRANTTMNPEGSEEFIIKRTKTENVGQQPLSKEGWKATADSEEKVEETPNHGFASNFIDGNVGTIWHTQYSGGQKPGMPHRIAIDLGKSTSFKAFAYTARYVDGHGIKVNGNIRDFELYVTDNADADLNQTDQWTLAESGTFDYEGYKGGSIYVNLKQEQTARKVMLVAKTNVNDNEFAGGAEFDLFADEYVKPVEQGMFLKTSDLKLAGDPVIEDTSATINKQEKVGKKLSFNFQPIEFNGAEYTITENIVAYNGDHYMRKYLEISVPEADKLTAEIDYIDLESLDVTNSKDRWTIPHAGGIVGTPEARAILGQPFYADGMFFGCEFPAADTQIVDESGKKIGRPRYYTGKTMDRLASDQQAARAKDGSIHYTTWQTVMGSANSSNYRVVQADFFDYIDDISAPSDFRIQYNSWYDEEKKISEKSILSSFAEMDREFSSTELRPLDSYVVDDGWTDWSANPGFWEFNNKFPTGFDNSSSLVQNFGSDFGVWIGPRGGYGTEGPIADSLQAQGISIKAGGAIDVADRTYLEHYANRVNEFQDKYNVNYWKWDGFADANQYNHFNQYGAGDGKPMHTSELPGAKTKGHMIGGANQMYHCTDMWEGWIELYKKVRANAEENGIDNYWISSTTHTMPSPWLLQWVNSVWIQCQFDHARSKHGSTIHDGNLNARDAVYYNFIEGHQFQFPLAHIYNHDPVYGKSGTSMNANTATAEQFQNYLYTIAGRGTAFWELYYSDSIFDTEKYEVNAEFLKWYEENFHLLKNARMFGGWPVDGVTLDTGVTVLPGHLVQLANDGNGIYNTYGYSGFEGDEGILTVRNANADGEQELKFAFDDATLGVKGNNGEVFDYVVERRHVQPNGQSKVEDKGTFTIGETVSLKLQPEESLTIHVTKQGKGDKKGPSISTVTSDGDKGLTVRMDEKVKGEAVFTINGEKIAADKVKRSADGITYHIELAEAPKAGTKLNLELSGVTDMAGNALEGNTASIAYHKDGVVTARCFSRLTTYAKKLATADKSLETKSGLTVFSHVKTTGHGPLVKQDGAYELGIDESGNAYFELNGVRATAGVVNDGKDHTIAGVRENNGILKVYVDGQVADANYNADNYLWKTPAGDITFAGGAFDKSADKASAKVFDRALGYNEIAKMTADLMPNLEDRNLALSKEVTAKWTKDNSSAEKGADGAMSLAVDGRHNSSEGGAYAEFGRDGRDESSYMEIDLGRVYELSEIKMWRYYKDGRRYKNTLVAVSEDGSFDKDSHKIIFNADTNNVHKLGAGSDQAYAESSAGHTFDVPEGTRARYVRVYMNGATTGNWSGTTNHVVECEVIGHDVPAGQGTSIDTSALYNRIDAVRDYIANGKFTPESVQKVMDKLEAAELVADCPKDEKAVKDALASLEGIESELKAGVTVSFQFVDAPEGVVAPGDLTVEKDSALGDKLPTPAEVEGYTFEGWFSDQSCAEGTEFDAKTVVSADMTVYGKWVKNPTPEPPVVDPEQKPEVKPDQKPGQNKPAGKPGSGLPMTGDNSMLPVVAAGAAGVVLVGAALAINKRRRAE